MPSWVVISLTVVLMLLGLVGSVLPALPGSPLILLGALIYAWHTDFSVIRWIDLIVLAALALAGQGLDYAATAAGAKKYGASPWGMAGAFVGGIIGLCMASVIGLVIGAFTGAIILEIVRGGELKNSVKVGYGTLVGFLCGAVGKALIACIMIGYFVLRVWL